ncbi:MAG: glucose-1-phosphate adenylyltransferase subunit GlgD [Clostridia bacterium]|nr:glucose-1-phosphate adenylyltransferase subunit GlgD [Clostridia bacterium]
MKRMMGIINLSERTEYIKELTLNRSIGSLPFAGRYRLIDFALSNMVNSRIDNVAIVTQGKTRSLMDHLGSGKPWDLNRNKDGLFVFHPDVSSQDIVQRKGDIEIFKDHLDYLNISTQEYVAMSRSYMVASVDYENMLRYHEEKGADITIVYSKVMNGSNFIHCDTVLVDNNHEIHSIGKNMNNTNEVDISLEMYLIKRELLIEIIEDAIQSGDADHLKQCIFNRLGNMKVYGYRHYGYVACVNSLTNYYRASMDMLQPDIYSELFRGERRVYTKVKNEPPAKYANTAVVQNALIGSGCIIKGTVINSVIARGVTVEEGAVIKNSIILQNANISKTSNLNYMIIDKNVTVSAEKHLNGDINHPYVVKKNAVL